MNGKLLIGYTVRCGLCKSLEVLSKESRDTTKADAEAQLYRYDWLETDEYGWICPHCYDRHFGYEPEDD